MKFSFHPEAIKELNKAVDYYEDIDTGLGYDFALEVFSTIKRIIKFPEAWSLIDDNIRRSLVSRFPYGVLYSLENNEVIILAIMNLHRHPVYWKNRK